MAKMDFKKISQQIQNYSVAKSHSWEVIIYLPKGAVNKKFMNQKGVERISIACETIDFPSNSFTVAEKKIEQQLNKIPTLAIKNDISITFRLSEDMFEKKFFEEWRTLIQDPVTRRYGYLDDYSTTIDLIQYSTRENNEGKLEKVFATKLYSAYPIDISSIQGDQSLANNYFKQTVTINYQDYDTMDIVEPFGDLNSSKGFIRGIFDNSVNMVESSIKNIFKF